MTSYRPLVAWTHIILGVLALVPLLILTAVFGGVWAIVAAATQDAAVSGIMGASLGVVLVVAMVSTTLAAAFSLAAGALSLKGYAWGDGMLLVASFFHLLNFPLGTVLALFGGWVLLFREPRARLAPPRAEWATVR
jgi:hypothetical protein